LENYILSFGQKVEFDQKAEGIQLMKAVLKATFTKDELHEIAVSYKEAENDYDRAMVSILLSRVLESIW
jgi:hypothetical protein